MQNKQHRLDLSPADKPPSPGSELPPHCGLAMTLLIQRGVWAVTYDPFVLVKLTDFRNCPEFECLISL